jgi:fatty acid desaturase
MTRARARTDHYSDPAYGAKYLACLLLGMPFTAAGILLIATIVWIWIGIPVLILGGVPLYILEQRHARRKREWENEDKPLETTATPPWLLDENDADA